MADAAGQDEEMEDGVHVFLLVEGIEDGTRDVAYAFGDKPHDGSRRDGVHQRLEGHEHAQTHADETECLQIRVFLQSNETDNRSRDGTSPDKREEAPPPVALLPQGRQRQRGIRTRNVPIDGSMIPLPEPLLPFRAVTQHAL